MIIVGNIDIRLATRKGFSDFFTGKLRTRRLEGFIF